MISEPCFLGSMVCLVVSHSSSLWHVTSNLRLQYYVDTYWLTGMNITENINVLGSDVN